MNKYCERLKELNALDKKAYQQVIQDWKRRDLKARNLLLLASSFLSKDLPSNPLDNVSISGVLLRMEILEFLSKTSIGK